MLTPEDLEGDPLFPWLRGLQRKPVPPNAAREPERAGESADDCPSCRKDDADYLWSDETWRLWPMSGFPLRGCVMLESRLHVDSFVDMPSALLVSLGPTTARIERAVLSIGDVGRVHVARWGDGLGHFHLWFLPRPVGALHMRGSGMIPWLEALDPPNEIVLATAHEAIRAAMNP